MTLRRRRARARATAVGLAILAVTGCEVPPVLLPNHRLLRDVYVRGPETAPVVALTFDDGPNGRCTADVLDALAESGTPATFFVLGRNVGRDGNAVLLARMVREGHTIGLHGWAHSTNPLMRESWAARDLTRSRNTVAAAVRTAGVEPPRLRFYRPPYGFVNGPVARAAAAARLAVVEWTVSVEDWRQGWTGASLSDAVARDARPGDVIVLHDGDETRQASVDACVDRRALADAVRLLVPALRARGLHVAPLADVLAMPPDSR